MIVPAHIRVLRRVNFKGGGGGGDSYDAAYNARMATIAEAQQGMAETYFNFWESDYKPMEQAQIQANQKLIPSETNLALAQNKAAASLIPGQTSYAQAGIDSAMKLLPHQTDTAISQMGAQRAMADDQITNIEGRAPVRDAFYQSALTGMDPDMMANRAAADATQSFMGANSTMRRNAARMGVNPASGAFQGMANQNALNQAKTVAGASTQARTQAENDNFTRLQSAMGYGG